MQCYRLKSEWRLVLLCIDIFALFNVHAYWFFVIVETGEICDVNDRVPKVTTGMWRLLFVASSVVLQTVIYKGLYGMWMVF